MSDVSIHTAESCEQNEYFTTKFRSETTGETYQVRYDAQLKHPWECDCPGFKYRKRCKHVTEAKQVRCTWGVEAAVGYPSTPKIPGVCPDCSGPTTVIKYAV